MRRRWLTLWAIFVLALVAINIGVIFGVFPDPLTNFYSVIVAIAVIGILAIIGAVFVGVFLAQRILSSQEFTPFEKEMLAMREDVKKLTAKVEGFSSQLAADPKERR